MKSVIVTGKTLKDAIESGLEQLGTTEDRVKVTILEQPAKGLFGIIGSKDAKVQLEYIPDAVEQATIFLKDVLQSMDMVTDIETVRTDDNVTLNITGEELGILIGRRGQTLDSLQYLVNIVANRYSDKHQRVILDAEQFRERRKQTLEQLSQRLADRVIRTKKEVVLEPMPPQERKIIHTYLQDHPKVKTYSRGDEPNRSVVVTSR